MIALPHFDEVREDEGGGDYGDIMGFDLRGHHDSDVVDLFLATVVEDEYEIDPGPGGWDVTHEWRHTIPNREGGGRYYYAASGGRGWTPVTRIAEPPHGRAWCINHPFEPYSMAVPATSVLDGEALIAKHAIDPDDPDPRRVVESACGASQPGYINLCRACAKSFREREAAARKAALADFYSKQEAS